jgi:hypothetical protein
LPAGSHSTKYPFVVDKQCVYDFDHHERIKCAGEPSPDAVRSDAPAPRASAQAQATRPHRSSPLFRDSRRRTQHTAHRQRSPRLRTSGRGLQGASPDRGLSCHLSPRLFPPLARHWLPFSTLIDQRHNAFKTRAVTYGTITRAGKRCKVAVTIGTAHIVAVAKWNASTARRRWQWTYFGFFVHILSVANG